MLDDTVPTPKLVLPEQPKTDITSAVFNRPLPVGIGGGLEQLGSGAEALSADLARQQAQSDIQKQAVTLDANGVPQMANDQNSIILGEAGEVYQQAWNVGERARLSSAISGQVQAIRQQHEGDPAGFLTAMNAYSSALRQTSYGPTTGNALADQANDEGQKHYANMSERMFEIGTKQALGNIQTDIGDTQNRMRVIARQGGIDTPEYDALQDKLQDRYDDLKGNPLFGYAPERADSELNAALSTNRAESVIGQVDSIFRKTGGDGGKAGAQKLLTDNILNNADLNLSDPERKQLYAYGMAHLEYLTSNQKAAIDANRQNVDKLISSFDAHRQVDQGVINQAVGQAQALGDAESVMRIQAYAAQARKASAYAGLTDEQRLQAMTGVGAGSSGSERQALDYFVSQGWTKEQASGIVGNLIRESGLNTGATNRGDGADGSDSIGIGQWNGQRAEALKTFAGQQGRSPGDFQTQLAFVQHELQTSEGNAAAMLRKAQTPQDAAAAFALGYERPQGFLTGDISKVTGGSERVANAVRLAGGNVSSAPIFATTGSRSSAPTPAQMQANPFVMTAYLDSLASDGKSEVATARNVGEALATAYSLGQTPSPVTVAAFNQAADAHPDQLGEVAQKVRTQQTGAGMAASALAAPAPQAAAYQQQIDAIQHAPGAPLAVLAAADAAQKIHERGVENLKKDPFGEAANRGWIARQPIPLDFSQPQSVPQALAERGQAAGAIASFTGNPAQSMIAPAELPQFKSIMSGPLDQRTALVVALGNSGATPGVMRATLGALAGDKQTLPLAVAAGVYRDSPETARGILQGQAILQQEPKFAPKAEAMTPELATAIAPADLPGEDVRGGIATAARAMYAKMSFDANDTTGVVNTDRMDQAIAAVTGGIRSYRGSSFIAPWYGATPYQTDAAIRTLGDDDFKGARTADGQPFSAAALKPSFADSFTWNNWRLQSVGDGKYLVYSGADNARQYLGAAAGGKFILNLGAKRAQVEAADVPPPSQTPFSALPAANMPFAGPM